MEDSNNLNEGFNEMNQEEIEAEEYPEEEQIDQDNNNNQLEDELILKKDHINQEELNFKNPEEDEINNQDNELDHLNKNQIIQQKQEYDNINRKENEIIKNEENNLHFQQNNNINNSNQIPIENSRSQEELQDEVNQKRLKQLKEEIENITDSDIDDPKYRPNSNPNVNTNQNNNMNTNNSIENRQSYQNLQKNPDFLNLQSKIMYLENNNNLVNQTIYTLESENKILKTKLAKKDNIIKSKEDLNKEYQNLLSVFKDKLIQSEKYLKIFQNQIEDLKIKLNEKDKLVLEYKKRNDIINNSLKNIPIYTEQIKDIQKKYEDKEAQNKEKYNEKEKKLIKDFMDEINKSTKRSEELKIENEKLKYDLNNLNNEITNLNNKISEMEFEKKDLINKNNLEINQLKEKIKLTENELNEKDIIIKDNIKRSDNNILKCKNENNSLIQQINELKQQNKQCLLEIMSHKHNLEMMSNEMAQNEITIKNKDSIIEQLRNQINEMNLEIDERMNDLQIYEENSQKEIDEYNNKIQELIREKTTLEINNNELSQNLNRANDTLKEYNDIVVNKYKNLEDELYKEKQNKITMEQKYKNKIESMKLKNNSLLKENNMLKDIINNQPLKKNFKGNIHKHGGSNNLNNNKKYDVKVKDYITFRNKINIKDLTDIDSHINRTMFNFNYKPNKEYNTMKNNRIYNLAQSSNFMNNTINSYKNKKNVNKFSDSNIKNNILNDSQIKQINMINEFKTLLNQIDEKLEIGKNK